MSSDAGAGGVQFGFGIDVQPPVVVNRRPPPPVVVERMPAPPPVVVERTPLPVVVERTVSPPPVVVEHRVHNVIYDEPVVVARRSSVYYYYRPAYRYHSYHVETEREYYRQRSYDWDNDEY